MKEIKKVDGKDWESAIAEMEAEWSAHVDKHIHRGEVI